MNDVLSTLQKSLDRGLIYDPEVSDAGPEGARRRSCCRGVIGLISVDYPLTAMSIAIASLSRFSRVVTRLLPYVIMLAAFGGFIVWNGGVVLGTMHVRAGSHESADKF